MKILFVTPWVPSRRRPRAARLIALLSEDHEVDCLSAAWSESERDEEYPSAIKTSRVILLSKTAAVLRVARAVLSGRSLQQAYVEDGAFKRAVREAAETLEPNLVIFNVIRSAGLAECLPAQANVAIDLDEIRSGYYSQLGRSSRSLIYRLIGKLESPRMRRAEEAALCLAKLALVSSPSDLHAGSNVRLVRTPILDIEGAMGVDHRVNENRVTMVGRMSYRANQEAVRWFLDNVWPEVRLRHPAAVFQIVGEAPPRWMRRIKDPSITVTGRVPSVEKLLRESSASVVPVTLATGVQLKLLEAFSVGVPVVTTPLVARLAGVTEEHCFIASSAPEWIDQLDAALRSRESSHARARRALSWVEANHGMHAVQQQLRFVLAESDWDSPRRPEAS